MLRGEARTLVKGHVITALARRSIISKVPVNVSTLFSQERQGAICSMVGHLRCELALPASGKQICF